MELLYNAGRVKVVFNYVTEVKEGSRSKLLGGRQALQNIRNNRVITYCQIVQKDNNESTKSIGLSAGYSIRNPTDQFNKAFGRKMALHAAVRQLPNSELRSAIWNEYFKQHRH